MKIYKYLLAFTFLFLACLTPLDRAKEQATSLIKSQHQTLVDFVTWDKKHQLEIVQAAKTKALAKKQLIDYRKRRDVLLDKLVLLLGDEDPDALVGLIDTSQTIVILSKIKQQDEELRAKILEFERGERTKNE